MGVERKWGRGLYQCTARANPDEPRKRGFATPDLRGSVAIDCCNFVQRILNSTTGAGRAAHLYEQSRSREPRYPSHEAVTHLNAWLVHAKTTAGPVFRRIENTGAIGSRTLHPQEVGRIIQAVARNMNANASGAERPWPNIRLGVHSTRIGAAHDLAAAGIDLTSIMHSGGWNDPKMPRYYTRELAAKDSGMARMVRARNVDASK
jgi:hypothetical protein